MLEKLNSSSPLTLEIWMISAGLIGFGLGGIFIGFTLKYGLWVFLIGLAVHAWAMYKIYLKAK